MYRAEVGSLKCTGFVALSWKEVKASFSHTHLPEFRIAARQAEPREYYHVRLFTNVRARGPHPTEASGPAATAWQLMDVFGSRPALSNEPAGSIFNTLGKNPKARRSQMHSDGIHHSAMHFHFRDPAPWVQCAFFRAQNQSFTGPARSQDAPWLLSVPSALMISHSLSNHSDGAHRLR